MIWKTVHGKSQTLFFCSHWHMYRYFCILYSKRFWSANPFLFAPFHFTLWMTHLFDGKHTTWEEKGNKNSLSKRENMRGILNSVIQNMFYTCTYCMKFLPHLLLLLLPLFYTSGFNFKLHISSIFSVDDLPDLT